MQDRGRNIVPLTVDVSNLSILHYPAPVLRKRSEPLADIDERVREVAARMIELMHEAEGVGLAAPQVGLAWRLFVCRGAEEDDPEDVFVNPELELERSELEAHEEGCLSLPGIRADIRRPMAAKLTATDLRGQPVTRRAEGFMARVWQHEFDHLNGVLIIDRMTPLDRIATRRALKALEAGASRK